MFACEPQDGRDFSIGIQPGFATSGIKPVPTSTEAKQFALEPKLPRSPVKGIFLMENLIIEK